MEFSLELEEIGAWEETQGWVTTQGLMADKEDGTLWRFEWCTDSEEGGKLAYEEERDRRTGRQAERQDEMGTPAWMQV